MMDYDRVSTGRMYEEDSLELRKILETPPDYSELEETGETEE